MRSRDETQTVIVEAIDIFAMDSFDSDVFDELEN